MNIEIKKLLSTLIEKIEEDINISFENLVEVNQSILDTLPVRMFGMAMESALSIHMETS
jgi:hypothetical protein